MAGEEERAVEPMTHPTKNAGRSQAVFILAGSSTQYSAARQKLGLSPREAFWLTRASDLSGLHQPKVYRTGEWKALPRIQEIEEAITATGAEVSDLS
jgi:hypothetical protein